MYYEEAIVDFELCYRVTPQGEWIPYSTQELTLRLREVARIVKDLHKNIKVWEMKP